MNEYAAKACVLRRTQYDTVMMMTSSSSLSSLFNVCTICLSTFRMRKRKHSLQHHIHSGKTMQVNSVGLHVLRYFHPVLFYFFFSVFLLLLFGWSEEHMKRGNVKRPWRRHHCHRFNDSESKSKYVRCDLFTFNCFGSFFYFVCVLDRVQHICIPLHTNKSVQSHSFTPSQAVWPCALFRFVDEI